MSQLPSFVLEVKTCIPNTKKQTSKFCVFQWGAEETKEFEEVNKILQTIIPSLLLTKSYDLFFAQRLQMVVWVGY